MISLFQTANGLWHIPSILMASSWLIGTIVAGGFMFANLRVNRNDRLNAQHEQSQAYSKITHLENDLVTSQREQSQLNSKIVHLDDDRATVQYEQLLANSKIVHLEKITTPKPFKSRLLAFLDSLHMKADFRKLLKSGQMHFMGDFTPAQFADLQRLASEPEAQKFISINPDAGIIFQAGVGPLTHVKLTINPNLLEP